MYRLILALLAILSFGLLITALKFSQKKENPSIAEIKINDSLKTLKKEIKENKDSILILKNELQRISQSNNNN